MMCKPIKVICVLDYYLPGFKGGGPIRTIANMRKLLAGDVDLAIFTRDRDLGSDRCFSEVRANCWIEDEDGLVYYASPKEFSATGLKRAMAGHCFNLLYLNSFFSFRSSIQMYIKFRHSIPSTPVLLAPRGEFSSGALAMKHLKKRLFLSFSTALGLYRDITWHASTTAERDDILRLFPAAFGKIHLAEDPVDIDVCSDHAPKARPSPPGQLRLVFISRISPMKNLDGLLRILSSVTCLINLDIFGPIQDMVHWHDCQRLIAGLPPNVIASYRGAITPDAIPSVFSSYDLFALPTHGENFGHVIFEALRAGTPVLLSDRTPWKADALGAVSIAPLSDIAAWKRQLSAAAGRSVNEKLQLRQAARAYAEDFAHNSGIIAKNVSMFQAVAGAKRSYGMGEKVDSQDTARKP